MPKHKKNMYLDYGHTYDKKTLRQTRVDMETGNVYYGNDVEGWKLLDMYSEDTLQFIRESVNEWYQRVANGHTENNLSAFLKRGNNMERAKNALAELQYDLDGYYYQLDPQDIVLEDNEYTNQIIINKKGDPRSSLGGNMVNKEKGTIRYDVRLGGLKTFADLLGYLGAGKEFVEEARHYKGGIYDELIMTSESPFTYPVLSVGDFFSPHRNENLNTLQDLPYNAKSLVKGYQNKYALGLLVDRDMLYELTHETNFKTGEGHYAIEETLDAALKEDYWDNGMPLDKNGNVKLTPEEWASINYHYQRQHFLRGWAHRNDSYGGYVEDAGEFYHAVYKEDSEIEAYVEKTYFDKNGQPLTYDELSDKQKAEVYIKFKHGDFGGEDKGDEEDDEEDDDNQIQFANKETRIENKPELKLDEITNIATKITQGKKKKK